MQNAATGPVASNLEIAQSLPIVQKNAVFLPTNYRGLHLIPVLSKVVERIIKIPFGNFIEAIDGCGEAQLAFQRKRGCTDLVLLFMCS